MQTVFLLIICFKLENKSNGRTKYEREDCRFWEVHSLRHTRGTGLIIYKVPHNGSLVICELQGGIGINGLSRGELADGRSFETQLQFYDMLLNEKEIHVDSYTPAHNGGYNLMECHLKDDGSGESFIDPDSW